MNEDFGFSLQRRGAHPLAGRTVLQVVSSLVDLEADRAAVDVAGALAEAGARPLVAAPAGRLVSELQAKGGLWLDFPSQAGNPITMALQSRQLKALIAREQVDLVHARSRRAGWMAYAATRGAKVPLVTGLSQLAPGQSMLKQRYTSVMAKGDAVIASSNFATATIASVYPDAAGRVALVRPGVDLKPFSAGAIAPARVQALRHAWAAAPDERIVILVAKPSIWKGHKVLIDAVRLLVEAGLDDLRLVFIGDAKDAFGRELDLAVKAANIADRVHRVAGCADMPAALLAAAAVVVPSIEAEAFGRIAIQAQGVGTPVIVSDLGALPETVLAPPEVPSSKRTGWRVSPSDPVALAAALRESLALGASGRAALAMRAREQVKERFSIERMARETLAVYAHLVEQDAALA